MNSIYVIAGEIFQALWARPEFFIVFLPVMIAIEIPLILLVTTGVFRWAWRMKPTEPKSLPSISFIITCYSEGDSITSTIETLVEQVYPAPIEILIVVDGAKQNAHTYAAAIRSAKRFANRKLRNIKVIPKWQRGGRVSTLNAGLSIATHELVINVDGDTSFDNNMCWEMALQFSNENMIACGGALRVRNARANVLTRMQSLEYMMSMQAGKTGMSDWGVLNNISGAFGAFRKQALKQIGGWDTHTAEDLDLTTRFKQYKVRHPNMRLGFAPHAVGHTDVPDTIRGLVLQRLRWEGDLLFLFLRKHKQGLNPRLLGWGNFLFTLVYGVIQNVVLPLLMVGYTMYIIVMYPPLFVAAVFLNLYILYLVFILINFTVYMGLVSERKNEDLKMAIWLPLYPIYSISMRFITAFSMINEVSRRSHEESSMAPWWVLKRGKRF